MSDPAFKSEPMGQWFVWTKTGRRPTYVHHDQAAAAAEARRLALKYPDKKFIVMQAVEKVSVATLSAPVGGVMRYRFKPVDGGYIVQWRFFLFFWNRSAFGWVPADEAVWIAKGLLREGCTVAKPLPVPEPTQ